MNNLDVSFKIKRRNRSMLTQPNQNMHKTASQHKKISPFSKLEKPLHQTAVQSSKILPKNIPYDKESLYLQVLSLKMELNQIMDENIRLKTRVVVLQKEMGSSANSKIHNSQRYLLPRFYRDKYELSRNNEGLLIEGLKKLIKQTKHQCQTLKNQNLSMKKNLKISKTNELEIQLTAVIEENKRLLTINEELQRKLQAIQSKDSYLQKDNLAMKGEMKFIAQQNTTLKSYIRAIQLQQRIQSTNSNVKQRPNREMSSQKRKQVRNIGQVKRELLFNKEAGFRINKKQQFRAMRIQYNMLPIRREPIPIRLLKEAVKAKIINDQQPLQLLEEEKNKRLIKSCQSLQRTLQKANKQRINQIQIQEQKQQKEGEACVQQIKIEENVFQAYEKQKRQASETAKIQYSSAHNQQKNQRAQKINDQQGFRAHSEPQSSPIQRKHTFKTNKRVIGQICQLLTLRMMAQRYSYAELKADIQQSASKQFSFIDLCHMLVNEPFYLTVDYCRILLSFIFEKEKPAHNDVTSSMALLAKLRRLIKDFETINEQQQGRMIKRCANAITEHSNQIKNAFAYAPNQNKTVRQQQLVQMLTKFKLGESEINMILSELSICSKDLTHLDLDVLFQRFDLNQLSSDTPPNHIIEETENDDSFINSKHKEDPKHQQNANKSHKNGHSEQHIKREVEEHKKMTAKKKPESQLPA